MINRQWEAKGATHISLVPESGWHLPLAQATGTDGGNEAPGASWRVKTLPRVRNWDRRFSPARMFPCPRLPIGSGEGARPIPHSIPRATCVRFFPRPTSHFPFIDDVERNNRSLEQDGKAFLCKMVVIRQHCCDCLMPHGQHRNAVGEAVPFVGTGSIEGKSVTESLMGLMLNHYVRIAQNHR